MSDSNDTAALRSAISNLSVSSSSSSSDSAAAAAAAAAADADLSLPQHLYRVQRGYRALMVTGTTNRTVAAFDELIASCRSLLQRIDIAALFSSNEEAEDLTTASYKYLLTHYYLAQLVSSYPCGISERLSHVRNGVSAYVQFIRLLRSYKLIDDAKELNAINEHIQTFEQKLKAPAPAPGSRPPMPGMGVMSSGSGGKRIDPMQQRNEKIARFKREKQLQEQITQMQTKRREHFRKKRDPNTITSTAANDDIEDELLDEEQDDESLRQYYRLLIQSLVISTADALRSAADEIDILRYHGDIEMRKPPPQQLQNMSEQERVKALQSAAGVANGGPPKQPVLFKMTPESLNQPIPDNMKHLLRHVGPAPGTAVANTSSLPAANGPRNVGHSVGISGSVMPATFASGVAAASSSVTPSTVTTRVDDLIAARMPTRDAVFKLTNQPLYSIEQWAEMEIAAGRMPGPSTAAQPKGSDPRRVRSRAEREADEEAEARRGKKDEDEDEDELGYEDGEDGRLRDEQKTIKDREWDNWKDDHQKGVGNTMK